uniref:(northern house mosquito) hypothetical protein n=1 Tax=Culex pipiens TaxID=7175 RepID=A0A8D8CI49_CULPI
MENIEKFHSSKQSSGLISTCTPAMAVIRSRLLAESPWQFQRLSRSSTGQNRRMCPAEASVNPTQSSNVNRFNRGNPWHHNSRISLASTCRTPVSRTSCSQGNNRDSATSTSFRKTHRLR